MAMPRTLIGWLLLLTVTLPVSAAGPGAPVTDAEVDAALQRMRAWLYGQQNPTTGSFDDSGWREVQGSQDYHATGETALITYALLLSGESHQNPRLAKAIDFLRNTKTNSTYLASLRAHIWARLPEDQTKQLETEADYLRSAEHEGRFHYQADHPTWSNSLTQYGMLGMWEYAKRGGEVKNEFWEAVGEHIFTDQNDDGGWGYNNTSARGGGDSTGSMTAAGVAILQLAQQRLAREAEEPNARLTEAIEKGMAWLDQRFDPAENPGLKTNYRFYYLYGIERLALAGGLSTLNGLDWFEAGSRFILDQEAGNGYVGSGARGEMSSRINTAFALSFLARGRVPVWISKLKLPRQTWDTRPNDLYFLNAYLSDQREAELNWQIVSIDDDPAGWVRTPLLYLSGSDRVQLSEDQQARLKRYLDLGGTLMLNAEGRGSAAFRRSMDEVVEAMYPQYRWTDPPDDHPFHQLIAQVRGNARMQTISNGVRDLVIMPKGDWGWDFQAGEAGKAPGWEAMLNVYAAITDRGELSNRLIPVLPRQNGEVDPSGSVKVVRVSHGGNWNAEPLALEVAGMDLLNRSGKTLAVEVQTAAELGELIEGAMRGDNAAAQGVLVHLTDPGDTTLSDEELAGLIRLIQAGGTALIETVGGRGNFADGVGVQIVAATGGERKWLPADHPIITGKDLVGGVDASRVLYRSFTQTQSSPGDGPSLAGIFLDGRLAVILSPRDLSLGVIGSRLYRINGYTPPSARALMGNLILWATGSE